MEFWALVAVVAFWELDFAGLCVVLFWCSPSYVSAILGLAFPFFCFFFLVDFSVLSCCIERRFGHGSCYIGTNFFSLFVLYLGYSLIFSPGASRYIAFW